MDYIGKSLGVMGDTGRENVDRVNDRIAGLYV